MDVYLNFFFFAYLRPQLKILGLFLKKTFLIFLCSHTLIFYLKGKPLLSLLSNFLLFISLFHVALFGYLFLYVTSLFGILKHQTKLHKTRKSFFFSSWFHILYFLFPWEDTRGKVIKFFVILFIYKILFLFFFELRIHYFFNKE